MSNINFEACNTMVFDPSGINMYYLKLVEEGTSKKGKKMWICHFVPVVKKDEPARDSNSNYTFFPSELTEWVVFDENDNITNPIGVSKWGKALSRDGETHIGRILKNAMNNPSICAFVLCDVEESPGPEGKTYINYVPYQIWKKQPTDAEALEARTSMNGRKSFNNDLKASLADDNDDDDIF